MTRIAPASFTALAIAATLASTSTATSAQEPEPGDAKVFVGYLFGAPKDVNFSLYTHLNHAFVTAEGDGRLKQGRNVPNRELTRAAHEANVKVLISLGGWGWDRQFGEIVADQDAENRYVEAVLGMVDEYDYDGVDLDWEYPDTEKEVPGFERLTRTFRQRLDAMGKTKGKPMFVTMAASSNLGTLDSLDTAFLVENFDWVNVMTYDYAGEWSDHAGHNSPLFGSSKEGRNARSIDRTMTYLVETRKVPPSKLAVGVPLYGRGFAVAEPYAPTKKGERVRMPGLNAKDIPARLDEGWKRTWDPETKTPWLTSPDGKMVAGYDDAESTRLKAEYAMSKGFRGVFFWQIDGDRIGDGTNPLQEAARKVWVDAQAAAK